MDSHALNTCRKGYELRNYVGRAQTDKGKPNCSSKYVVDQSNLEKP